ncbi:MAG: hypothetical protein ACI9UQ_001687 [Candidatus Krumholzibacteriia bacterium]|jgi:hypothetical protein
MEIRYIVLGVTAVVIVVISVVAIVMSTSTGTDTCETIWNNLEDEDKPPNEPSE